MELAAEVAVAVAKVVGAWALEEITVALEFEQDLENLKSKFRYIQAFLNDVGNATHSEKSELVNHWLLMLKGVTNSAENLMDDYAYEMLRRKHIANKHNSSPLAVRKKYRKYYMRNKMGWRVKGIMSDLDGLEKEANTIGLCWVELARESVSTPVRNNQVNNPLSQARRHAAATTSDFVGRKNDQEIILQKLSNPPNNQDHLLPIIAIVGIGGLGKTTLARRIFDREDVNGYSTRKKVWICVSEDFNVNTILREIFESLTSKKCDLANIGGIINKLQEILKGQRFLLVLDDVWEDNQNLWDALRNELQRICDPSKTEILITTRRCEAATKARAVYTHKLKGLSEEDGWALLKQKAFGLTSEYPKKTDFERVGKSIVNKCKGVPLAIKAIGALLQSRKRLIDWESILTSEFWDFQQNGENDILPSLLLSYTLLPSVPLKQCFAYCSIYPKDSKLEKQILIALWMAQGFLHESQRGANSTSTTEDIGDDYFHALRNNLLIEDGEEVDALGEVKWYKMHDLVHDLASYVSKKDMLVLKPNSKRAEGFTNVRHMVNFGVENKEMKSILKRVNDKNLIRTISFLGVVPKWDLISCAAYMRVLIVAQIELENAPVIGTLKHLRYLDLSDTKIKTLPESIYELYQLQTLRLKGKIGLDKLPKELYMLESLRHVETSKYMLGSRGIQKLVNLQTLPHLILCDSDDEGWKIEELKDLDNIRGKVYIKGLEHVKNEAEAKRASLGTKEGILELKLEWNPGYKGANTDDDVLASLQPHPNLKSFDVSGFPGTRFPCWIKTVLVNVVRLELIKCERCVQLPTLGEFPLLKILKLKGLDKVVCIGNDFYGTPQMIAEEHVLFRALRELYIQEFKNLTTWAAANGIAKVFPCLETFTLEKCPKLEKVPDFYFKSLQHLKLDNLGGIQPVNIIKYSRGLRTINISKIASLKEWSLPHELLNCTNLEKMKVFWCTKLKSLLPSGKMMISLKDLNVSNCETLTCIPSSLANCTALESLRVNQCPSIKCPIPDVAKLQRLEHLILIESGEFMTSMAEFIPQLQRLRYLKIGGFTNAMIRATTNRRSTHPISLMDVELSECPKIELLPEQLQCLFPSTLQSLKISSFKSLKRLPHWIGNLTSLKKMSIIDCPKLESLPPKQAMLGLSELSIKICPLWKERYANNDMVEWDKISHIPHIEIDSKFVCTRVV